MKGSIRFSVPPFFGDVLPRPETIRDCPALNPPIDLQREIDALIARTLHPGHAGPLNNAVPGERDLRHGARGAW